MNNFGGVTGKTDKGSAATVLDTKTGKLTYVQEVGALPEDVVLSPDGKFVAVVVGNGSATVKNRRQLQRGVRQAEPVCRRQGQAVAWSPKRSLGHACQGVVWSDDGKRLLVQCSVERDIRTFDFDGKTLTERPEAALPMVSRPGAMVTSKTR